MLRKAVVFVAILAACTPTYHPNPPGPPSPHGYVHPGLAIGAPVAAKWTDGKWYYGHITDIDGNRYAIDYADGDKGSVGPGEILPIAPPEQIAIGSRVMAVWKGASMYPGTVTHVSNGMARVQWDDGDLPIDVPFDRIALFVEGPAVVAPALQVGDRVAAKWKDGNWWYGSIGSVEPDGYVIHYADGDVLKVSRLAVIPVAQPGSLNVGDHVIAVWQGAKMYPGVITRIDANTATVKWDDGDTPLDVPLNAIAKR